MSLWIGIAIFACIWLVVRSLNNSKPAAPEPKSVSIRKRPDSEVAKSFHFETVVPNEDSFARVPAASTSSSGFSIPKAPSGLGEGVWCPSGMSVKVGDTQISGGMIYVGTSLKTKFNENDACLVDPTKSVAPEGDYTERLTDFWPSYSQISPSARRAYLNWLCSGRSELAP